MYCFTVTCQNGTWLNADGSGQTEAFIVAMANELYSFDQDQFIKSA